MTRLSSVRFPLAAAALTYCGLVGCSVSRDRLAVDQTPSAPLVAQSQVGTIETAVSIPPSDEATPEPRIETGLDKDFPVASRSLIQEVGFQDDDYLALDSDAAVQLAVPIDVESTLPQPAEWTLDAIEQLALANNPAIQQANAASARAGGIRTQVGLKPNPSVGYNGTQLADAGTDQHTVFVGQTFVRGDKLAWNRRVLDYDVRAMNWQIETQIERIMTDVRVAFYQALTAQKRLEIAREFRSVAEKGVAVSEAQFKGDIGTKPDVLQSEIQLNEVDLAIQQAEIEFNAAVRILQSLAGVDLAGARLVGHLNEAPRGRDEESEYLAITAASPQLAAAQTMVERARANLQRQKLQPIPNVNAQIGSGYDNATDTGLINVQVGIPLPIHNQNQGNIRAAQAEYCAAMQNVQRIRQDIRRQLANVMRNYKFADATVKRYEESILPKAQETLSLIQEAQAAGEFDFLRVLTARRAYFDANLRYVAALGDLAQANAKIDGMLLENGLSQAVTYDGGDDLRGQALSGQ